MPFISEAASAIKSRFGFHNHPNDSVPQVRSTPDLLKSASRENLAQSSIVRNIRDWDDDDDGRAVANTEPSSTTSSQSFEFREDPSFWKDHNVQVIIRIRPLSSSEISLQGYGKCVRQESCQAVTWTGHPESRFTFDLVADENVSQENLFKVAGVPMVENCVGGYNSCMFAYGQTGSGKTHTMLGDIEGGTRRHSVNCGMTPRVFEYLFSRIQKEKEARREEKLKFTCKCSFLEIYNEQILDLLEPSSSNLQIREDIKKGVYVENLKEIEVTSARDVIHQLIQGAANRKVAATNMNRASSRSHSVFTCIIESKWESQGVTHHRFARLNLVDLAGSERQKSSGAEGERLKEATNINKSLSTLGLVIMNLVNISNGKSLHVPYRDSKLTFLLQDSLGGNSKTTIIANISPSSCCSLETLSTLKFAQRAKFIKNNAIVNEDALGDVIAMRMQIQQLKKEVSRLRGLVSGGTESQDNESLAVSFPGSPGSFKWDGLAGSFSPLTSGKRMSQKKDYEVALVGAFRREKDKDIALQALAAESKAALQLAKQREDEIQGLKMRLRFREAGIKRLEAVASGKISAETHLLKEKEEHLKEIEVLRTQVNRNQEVTRFAMENLSLKEEIRRLKSFYEEGEREIMNQQIMVLQSKLLEALDWKLMHESDLSIVQKTKPDMALEVHDDDNLLTSNKEPGLPWQPSINEENEFLRMQAIQNQAEMDSLSKNLELCLEEKEKLERHVNDLATELEEERSSKAMKEGTQQIELPALSTDVPTLNFSDQMELKAMVDAIAAASQREAEAHETAIILSKENEELRMKIKVLIEDNNKLIELYERAAAECNYKNIEKVEDAQNSTEPCNNHGLVELDKEKEVEMNKVENLEHQLMEMHEENEKLMGLYERAMQERDELKRMLSSAEKKIVESKEFDCTEKLVEVDGGVNISRSLMSMEARDLIGQTDFPSMKVEDMGETQEFEKPFVFGDAKISIEDANSSGFHMQDRPSLIHDNMKMCNEENDFSTSNIHDRDDLCHAGLQADSVNKFDVGTASNMEIESSNCMAVNLSEDLNLARMKLEKANERLLDSTKAISQFGSLEKLITEVVKLSSEIEVMEDEIQAKQQHFESLKLVSTEMPERRALINKKLMALKNSLSSFCSSVAYFEQREARAEARVNASKSSLSQKKEKLATVQVQKDEIQASLRSIQQSEVELGNSLACLKLKLEEEKRKHENEKVLFAIDNVEKDSKKCWQMGGKATELLKSEEAKTKLQVETKLTQERLGVIRKEIEDLKRKSMKVDNEAQAVQMEIEKGLRSVEEMENALQGVIQEKKTLLEMKENGKTEMESLILEYQQHFFEADLKEAEMTILEEELQTVSRRVEELRKARSVAAEKTTQLLDTEANSCFVEKMEQELQSVRTSIVEAKSLLLRKGN
ncbi:kinesin-like protein KIN-12E [Ziziphus jujuba]|uniref:Kinesin-like protein KIN-12E n=1 Tax=Ziziphus jujuba TaxID=326968 RepID=A0A6P3Z819_ZIZJJ|nr:kinesin-like protein KIN-12E [Ziziphus jujuba]